MTYGVTWGEGDGTGGSISGLSVVKSALADTIADSSAANFTTTVSLVSEIVGMMPGDAIRLTARGLLSTFGLAGGFEIQVKTSGGDILLATGTQTVAANLTDRGWWLEADMIQLASGSNNQGTFHFSNTGRLAESMDMENGTDSATNINTASLVIGVIWGTADPANSITLRQLIVERIPNG